MDSQKGFEIKDGTLVKYTGEGGNVIVPDGIITIGHGAFSYRQDVFSILLPESVERIEAGAFYYCLGLKKINTTEKMKYWGAGAFEFTDIEAIQIPDTLPDIPDHLFCGCQSLQEVNLPTTIVSIGESAFWGSGLSRIEIPPSVTSVGDCAFQSCDNLVEVKFSSGVTAFPKQLFQGDSSLKAIVLPSSLSKIDRTAFDDCYGVEAYITAEDAMKYVAVDGVLFCRNQKELVAYPPAKVDETYYVPDTVLKIRRTAFRYARNLRLLFLPEQLIDAAKELILPPYVTFRRKDERAMPEMDIMSGLQ